MRESVFRIEGCYVFAVYLTYEGQRALYLDDLCVDENCRSKGIGKALYEAVVETAKNNGCYNLTLNVWAFNKRAYDFYKKLGFEEQKIGMEIIL